MKKSILSEAFRVVFDNDFGTNDRAYVPEVWAQESLMVLEDHMVAANLVHRDFEDDIKEFGDLVNTRRPSSFTAKRKTDNDDISLQDAEATKVQVKLNQYLYTSFLIRDGQMTRSFKDLVNEFLTPAVVSIATATDQIILNQAYGFMANSVGQLSTDPTKSTVISAGTKMNTNKAPGNPGDRVMFLSPNAHGALLGVEDFTKVSYADDAGEALKNANLGRKFGWDFYMCQNVPSVATTQTTQAAAINLSAGYAIGTTTLAIDGTSDTFTAGQWCTIAGDMTPQMIVTPTGTPTNQIIVSPGLKTAVDNDAVITVYPVGAVNLSAGYAAGWVKDIAFDAFSDAPLSGQMISHGTTVALREDYGLIGTPTTVLGSLDREVQTAMVNNDQLALGPAGDFCLGINKNAVALVSRPLAVVSQEYGVRQAVVNYNGLSIRVSMQYNSTNQGMIVTVDMLCGVKVLDTNLGVVMYA